MEEIYWSLLVVAVFVWGAIAYAYIMGMFVQIVKQGFGYISLMEPSFSMPKVKTNPENWEECMDTNCWECVISCDGHHVSKFISKDFNRHPPPPPIDNGNEEGNP